MEQIDVDTRAALKLWIVMNRALSAVEDRLRPQVEAHGLAFKEFAVLEVLLHKGALPIGEVGSRVLLTSGSMTYVIDKLEKRGLLERRACKEDRRVLHAELTDAGRALIDKVFPEHAALVQELMGDLSLEEKQVAASLLKRLGRFAAQQPAAEAP